MGSVGGVSKAAYGVVLWGRVGTFVATAAIVGTATFGIWRSGPGGWIFYFSSILPHVGNINLVLTLTCSSLAANGSIGGPCPCVPLS